MIQIDDFYINYKLILERIIKKMIKTSLDESKAYADDILNNIYNDRGTWNASADTFPSTGGSGPAGAIRKGDTWTIVVPGEPDNLMLEYGDTIRAFVDNPTQIQADWVWIENPFNYEPFKQSGDTITGTDGTGFLGLLPQTVPVVAPAAGIRLYVQSNGDLVYKDESNNVVNFETLVSNILTNTGDISDIFAELITIHNDISSKQSLSEKGQANGYAPLDANSKVPLANLPAGIGGGGTAGAIKYMGSWDADLNIINSQDLTLNGNPIPPADSSNEGYYFVVAYPGDTNIDGEDFWIEEDWIVSTGTNWIRVNNQSGVTSVNGRTGTNGAVVLLKADIGLGNVNNTSDLNKPVSTATQLALDGKEDKSQKGVNNGYAPLNSSGKIPSIHLPPTLTDSTHNQFYEITPTDVTNKFILLEYTPTDPSKVDLVIYGGIHQRALVDFLVVGNVLSWDGLALESLIEANHYLNITYSH